MSTHEPDMAARQAMDELQRYLSDQLAPMMVADSVEHLMRCPPAVAGAAIQGWVGSQFRGGIAGSLSDYLFHAMRKIQEIAQLRLIDKEPLDRFIASLAPIVLEACPEEDRASLKASIGQLGKAEASDLAPAVQVAQMRAGSGAQGKPGSAADPKAAGQTAVSEEVARGLKRFTLLLERLQGASGAPGKDGEGELKNRLLATAALNARSGSDLDQYLERLGGLGIDARTEQLFRALGRSLSGWMLPAGAGRTVSPSATSKPAEAMKRIVTMAPSPAEGVKRFTEMVLAAVELFNEGKLAQAAAMFEVAQRLVDEKKVDLDTSQAVRIRYHDKLTGDQLRRCAEKPETHAPLRRVLEFFPSLSVNGLLGQLDQEGKRDRRKLLLDLLEAHGPNARAAALERLTARIQEGDPDPRGYFTRNLVFLLRRIPRPAGEEAADAELEMLSRAAAWGQPLLVIKEAIGALSVIQHAKAEQAMILRLREYERLLVEKRVLEDAEEVRQLLNRVTAGLARMATPGSARAVVNHAFRTEPELGDTSARLAELAARDLSGDKELVTHLVESLKAEMPRKLLGFVVGKKSGHVLHLVQSLSGTPGATVIQVFQEIVQRFPDQEYAQAAARALAAFKVPPRPAEGPAMSLSGDLDLFGMPSLLQTVADARMTGHLQIINRQGQPVASLRFAEGRIHESSVGALTGEPAFYQLFERPLDGTFHFKGAKQAPELDKDARPIEVLPAMLEAMRRCDEFENARALVPDQAGFKATGTRPTGPPEGEDPTFLRAVWARASMGKSAEACESEVPADSYRIRRLYALWLEQGALQSK